MGFRAQIKKQVDDTQVMNKSPFFTKYLRVGGDKYLVFLWKEIVSEVLFCLRGRDEIIRTNYRRLKSEPFYD
jgi:hypothetical protein